MSILVDTKALSQYIPNSQYIELPEHLLIVISDLRSCLARANTLESERKEFFTNIGNQESRQQYIT